MNVCMYSVISAPWSGELSVCHSGFGGNTQSTSLARSQILFCADRGCYIMLMVVIVVFNRSMGKAAMVGIGHKQTRDWLAVSIGIGWRMSNSNNKEERTSIHPSSRDDGRPTTIPKDEDCNQYLRKSASSQSQGNNSLHDDDRPTLESRNGLEGEPIATPPVSQAVEGARSLHGQQSLLRLWTGRRRTIDDHL